MRKLMSSSAIAMSLAILATAAAPSGAFAGVMSVADPAAVQTAAPIEQAHYGRYCHRHYYRHYGYRPVYRSSAYYNGYPYYENPAGVVAGAAVDTATAPIFALDQIMPWNW